MKKNNQTRRGKTKKSKKSKGSFSALMTLIVLGFALIGLSSIVLNIIDLTFGNRIATQAIVEQKDTTKEDFIAELSPVAKQMKVEYGVLPSIILGQAILESDWGRSDLAAKYFNLFGVKNHVEGEGVWLTTKEYYNDQWTEIKGNFRVYDSWQASMRDHSLLFVNGVSWNTNLYKGVLHAKDYKEAAVALQEAGYATDPDYAEKIISVIETYELHQYDA